MNTIYTPGTAWINGKRYTCEWETSANMDCVECFIQTDMNFESEKDAESWAQSCGYVDDVDQVDAWKDGIVRLRNKP